MNSEGILPVISYTFKDKKGSLCSFEDMVLILDEILRVFFIKEQNFSLCAALATFTAGLNAQFQFTTQIRFVVGLFTLLFFMWRE